MTVNRIKLRHEILALLQKGAHRASWSDDNTTVDESELTPVIGDELLLEGETFNDEGERVRFSVSVYIDPDDIEIEDWER
jgi:hypothetical protein